MSIFLDYILLTDVTECGVPTCNGQGTCVEEVGGGYICVCNEGITGAFCDTDIDYCDSSPCDNGGSCIEEAAGFTCSCGSVWSGVTCGTGRYTGLYYITLYSILLHYIELYYII